MATKTLFAEATHQAALPVPDGGLRMRLRYGLNVGHQWRDLAFGPSRERLTERLREAGTTMVRVFFGNGKSPLAGWEDCAAFIEALQHVQATPMIALPTPDAWNDPGVIRDFVNQCGEFAARAADRWGSDAVSSWFWSIGDEPNSPWTNHGLTFEGYRDIYEQTATNLVHRIGSQDRAPRIGGPCVDGFQMFWFDWMWRFVEEIDPSLVGFAAWNWFGEWREPGTWAAPSDPLIFERLLLSRTTEYESRAKAVSTFLADRKILNYCCELAAHPHPDLAISGRYNRSAFGAVYYASALIDLIRGGADGEFLWAGAGEPGSCGSLNSAGDATPVYEVKKLIAQNVRFGDSISFPSDADPEADLDMLVSSCEKEGRAAAVIVYRGSSEIEVELDRWPEMSAFSRACIISDRDGGRLRSESVQGALRFNGYTVAVFHNGGALNDVR